MNELPASPCQSHGGAGLAQGGSACKGEGESTCKGFCKGESCLTTLLEFLGKVRGGGSRRTGGRPRSGRGHHQGGRPTLADAPKGGDTQWGAQASQKAGIGRTGLSGPIVKCLAFWEGESVLGETGGHLLAATGSNICYCWMYRFMLFYATYPRLVYNVPTLQSVQGHIILCTNTVSSTRRPRILPPPT